RTPGRERWLEACRVRVPERARSTPVRAARLQSGRGACGLLFLARSLVRVEASRSTVTRAQVERVRNACRALQAREEHHKGFRQPAQRRVEGSAHGSSGNRAKGRNRSPMAED